MINILDYHFIVTYGNMYTNDLTAKNYTIEAKSDFGAWIVVTSIAYQDITGREHIEKIELIEVE